jgi:hypothetical protein
MSLRFPAYWLVDRVIMRRGSVRELSINTINAIICKGHTIPILPTNDPVMT